MKNQPSALNSCRLQIAFCILLTAHCSPPTAHRPLFVLASLRFKNGARAACRYEVVFAASGLGGLHSLLRIAFRSSSVRYSFSVCPRECNHWRSSPPVSRAANQSGRSQGHQPHDRHAECQSANTGPAHQAASNQRSQGEPTRSRPIHLQVDAGTQTVSGPENARVFVYEGNVDARIGTYRLQADKVTVYEATNKVIAEGNVVFDQGDQQRITGSRAEWNYRTQDRLLSRLDRIYKSNARRHANLFHRRSRGKDQPRYDRRD